MAEEQKRQFGTKTMSGINEAVEWIFNKQINGEIDGKTADGLNTTIKSAIYLNVKLRMDYLKMILQANIKKIDLPEGLLPELENKETEKQ